MRNGLRSLVVIAAAVAAILALPAAAQAAPTTVGYDVSHPQCGYPLPSARAFGIVGVNGGTSIKANPCLATQLAWAWKSNGSVRAQPKAQLYLNTANPGEVRDQVTTWPASGSTPYGTCDGENTLACSWQYGWERAQNSVVNFFTHAAQEARVDGRPASYTWWLDVETANTWQASTTEGQVRNRASLEGMTAYLLGRGGTVGLYSTGRQWSQIVGTVPTSSNLAGRNSWLAGATTLSGARANCAKPPLTPRGRVTLAQYVVSGWDRNHSCV